MNYIKMKVKDFAQVISGGTPSTNILNFWGGNISWITPKDLSGYKARFISHGERNITEEGLLNSSARLLPKNTVLLTTRAPIGYVAISENELATNQGFKNLICKEEIAHFEFVYYMLKNSKELLESHATGSTFKELPSERLKEIYLPIPPLIIQKKIASILSTYDSLIENNRRRIQLLEQSARLLYREWFIYLRFPGHEHVRMIDGVPERWRKKKLKEVADVNAISLNNGFQEKIEYIDISSVTTGKINETTLYEFKDAPGRARRLVRHGDIIWSCVRPNRESHAIIWNPRKNLIASTGFAVISPIEAPTSYIYQALTTKEFVGYLTNNARGVAYPAVTGKDFESAEILIPTNSLLEQFDGTVKATIEQINVLKMQNNKLKEARDILLPRLMNGEITV
jgi:type I restriction enzyme S subunit